jgi:Spy/CpxP family protein refolding chaperone
VICRGLAAALLAVALAGVSAAGQAGQEGPGAQGAQGAPGERRPRDEAFRMIDAYIMSNIQESLQLTDDQYVKVLPLVKRLQTDRRAFAQRRQQALQELRRVLVSGGATEARVGELLRQVKAAEAEEPATLHRDRDAIDAVLTPVQQAKFRVMEIEVDHKIRELMNQIRAERRGQARPRRPGEQAP